MIRMLSYRFASRCPGFVSSKHAGGRAVISGHAASRRWSRGYCSRASGISWMRQQL